jgi:hypothetical protein
MDKNKTAFPYVFTNLNGETEIDTGMTLRDYFAAKAMQSFVTSTITNESTLFNKIKVFLGIKKYTLDFNLSGSVVSKSAYEVADAMLKEREK